MKAKNLGNTSEGYCVAPSQREKIIEENGTQKLTEAEAAVEKRDDLEGDGILHIPVAAKKEIGEEYLEDENVRVMTGKRKKGENVRKKGSKTQARVVSPYFQREINEGSVNKAKNLENTSKGSFVSPSQRKKIDEENGTQKVTKTVAVAEKKDDLGADGILLSPSAGEKMIAEDVLQEEIRRSSMGQRKRGEKVRRKGSKTGVRVVSPCSQWEVNEGLVVKKAKNLENTSKGSCMENTVRNVSPYFAPKEEVEVIRPAIAAGRKRVDATRVEHLKRKNPREDTSARSLGGGIESETTAKSSARCRGDGTESEASAKLPKKAPVLSAAQKRDVAYERRTLNNTWRPPRSPHKLLQEEHAFDPWRVLVICMLLNCTQGSQVFCIFGSINNILLSNQFYSTASHQALPATETLNVTLLDGEILQDCW